MEFLGELVDALMPACITFGPLFLVLEGKTPKYTRILRILGVAMVVLALVVSSSRLRKQESEISRLRRRVDSLEDQSPRAAQGAPCPPG